MSDREAADELAAIAQALRSLAPPHVSVGVRPIAAAGVDVDEAHVDEAGLFAEELDAIRGARPARRREFSQGRILLRELIGRSVSIPVAPNRAPVLPPGIRGSVAHDDRFVVAAASRDERVVAIGIDIEPSGPLEPDLARVILRADERHLDPHLAFTLKEAAYKAWSSLGGRILEHHEVRVHVSNSLFRAEVVPHETVFDGSFATVADRFVALVVVER